MKDGKNLRFRNRQRRPRRIDPCAAGLAILLASWPATSAIACKYCVRDVTFVDLGSDDYSLWSDCGPDAKTLRVALRDACAAFLVDSNISHRIVEDPASGERPKALATPNAGGLELAIVSARGPQLALPAPALGWTDQTLWDTLESLVSSPLRDRLRTELVSVHSIVLMVDGHDKAARERAAAISTAATRAIASRLDQMAKPIDRGPEVIRIDAAMRERERVLLWSLGLDLDDDEDTQLVCVVGRVRRIGAVLVVPGATARDLETQLDVVGLDCECGLDRRWMQGPAAPLEWPIEQQRRVADAIGFDAGHALVRTEISRILARDRTDARRDGSPATPPAYQDPLDYREQAIADGRLAPPEAPVRLDAMAASEGQAKRVVDRPEPEPAAAPTPADWRRTALLAIAGFAALVVLSAAFVLVRGRR